MKIYGDNGVKIELPSGGDGIFYLHANEEFNTETEEYIYRITDDVEFSDVQAKVKSGIPCYLVASVESDTLKIELIDSGSAIGGQYANHYVNNENIVVNYTFLAWFSDNDYFSIGQYGSGIIPNDVISDEHINELIDAKLGVIEDGTY